MDWPKSYREGGKKSSLLRGDSVQHTQKVALENFIIEYFWKVGFHISAGFETNHPTMP